MKSLRSNPKRDVLPPRWFQSLPWSRRLVRAAYRAAEGQPAIQPSRLRGAWHEARCFECRVTWRSWWQRLRGDVRGHSPVVPDRWSRRAVIVTPRTVPENWEPPAASLDQPVIPAKNDATR